MLVAKTLGFNGMRPNKIDITDQKSKNIVVIDTQY